MATRLMTMAVARPARLFLLGLLGTLTGIWADKFDQAAAVTNFLVTPLVFLSGTFYAVSRLPEPFLTASAFNPVFYLIDGFRYGLLGRAEADPLLGTLFVAVLVAGFWLLLLALLRAGWKLKS